MQRKDHSWLSRNVLQVLSWLVVPSSIPFFLTNELLKVKFQKFLSQSSLFNEKFGLVIKKKSSLCV